MTVQEAKAKEVLNNIWDFADAQDEEKGDVVDDAIIKAIGCMEEVEQYRALGTPTQILERIGGLDVELGKYHSLGTVEELKEAREKQIPKKPIDSGERIPFSYYCPTCKTELSDDGCKYGEKYCFECGQALK